MLYILYITYYLPYDIIKVLLYFGRQQLYNKHLDQKQHTTHNIPIKKQLLIKHIPMIISQSVGVSCILDVLKQKIYTISNIY